MGMRDLPEAQGGLRTQSIHIRQMIISHVTTVMLYFHCHSNTGRLNATSNYYTKVKGYNLLMYVGTYVLEEASL